MSLAVSRCNLLRDECVVRFEACLSLSVSLLLCCWSVSTSCSVCDHARALSGIEQTSAVSTGTVRDPCDQPSSSPRATSSRSPCTGSPCSSSSPGVLVPLSARGLARDKSSRRSATPPLQGSFTASASGTSTFVTALSRFTVPSDPSPCNSAIADT